MSYSVIALVGTQIPNSASYLAAFHLPAGVPALVIAVVPIFALLIALALGLERLQWLRLLGICLGAFAIALIVLSDTSLPVEDIAKRLGYAQPKSFRRAFNSWTGQSPSGFRSSG